MTASEDGFAKRWQEAVARLRLETEVLQATADELPPDVECTADQELWPDPLHLLRCHVSAFHNYTTALTCVQVLLRQYGKAET